MWTKIAGISSVPSKQDTNIHQQNERRCERSDRFKIRTDKSIHGNLFDALEFRGGLRNAKKGQSKRSAAFQSA